MTAGPAVTTGGIEARDFSFWYGEKQALHEVTVAVPPQQITAFIGPSGCGKSTFLRAINRMHDLVHVVLHPRDPRAVRHVVVDRLREGVRLLEDHADASAHLDRGPHAVFREAAHFEQPRLEQLQFILEVGYHTLRHQPNLPVT